MKKFISSGAKNLVQLTLTLLLGLFLCGYECNPSDPLTDPGRTINGVTWASRNVDAFGTFTSAPENPGMFYQWNNPTAWPVSGVTSGWNDKYPPDTWNPLNDPCPEGWRMPTNLEFLSLLDQTVVLIETASRNGVSGIQFIAQSSGAFIFLPFAGALNCDTGKFEDYQVFLAYWSSTPNLVYRSADALFIAQKESVEYINERNNIIGIDKRYGLSIRCVKK